MLEALLPDSVVAVEAREDADDIELFPAEAADLGQAVEKRRREYTTARACARTAFARLGLPEAPVVGGERGEPQWPTGIVGSITHCEGYRACAIARSREIVAIGIDAEPHAPIGEDLLGAIAHDEELRWLRNFQHIDPVIHWDRLLFSAKESVYKAWFPLAKQWLGFEDAIVTFEPAEHTFRAQLMVSGPVIGHCRLTGFTGRWVVRDGLVLTAITLAT